MSMRNDRDIARLQVKVEEMSLEIERLTKQVAKLKPKKKRAAKRAKPVMETKKDDTTDG